MSAFGLPDFKSAKDLLSGAGTSNANTRDLSAPSVVKMAIIPVNEPFNSNNVLLLNTNSVTESKAANWVKHYIPGQSDPLLQWINGSERTITFSAMVTKDIAANPTVTKFANGGVWQLVIQPELNEQFKIAEDYNASRLSSLASESAAGQIDSGEIASSYWSRSIQPQLDFYRSLVIPRKGTSAAFPKTPPLVQLRMGTILGTADDSAKQKFILINYQMTITEYSPQLEPTKANVNFTFVEYVPKSKSSEAQTAATPTPLSVDPLRLNDGIISDITSRTV